MKIDYERLHSILEEKESHARSAWKRGVYEYVFELLDELEENYPELKLNDIKELKSKLLNGADSWREYSYGECSLIYDEDIARRLCTSSELIRTHYGEKQLNASETWLDVQTRALIQAYIVIKDTVKRMMI